MIPHETVPQAIAFYQKSLAIKREIRDRQGEATCLGGLGNAYDSLGQYQKAITFHQQHLDISREIGDRGGEAIAWFNLGITLVNVQRKDDAMGAFLNARQLYQDMGLDKKVEDCDNAINALVSDISPPQPLTWWQKVIRWLRRLWQRLLQH